MIPVAKYQRHDLKPPDPSEFSRYARRSLLPLPWFRQSPNLLSRVRLRGKLQLRRRFTWTHEVDGCRLRWGPWIPFDWEFCARGRLASYVGDVSFERLMSPIFWDLPNERSVSQGFSIVGEMLIHFTHATLVVPETQYFGCPSTGT